MSRSLHDVGSSGRYVEVDPWWRHGRWRGRSPGGRARVR
jgi:hypothetical protein